MLRIAGKRKQGRHGITNSRERGDRAGKIKKAAARAARLPRVPNKAETEDTGEIIPLGEKRRRAGLR